MQEDDNFGFITAQLTIARWYLGRMEGADADTRANHLRSARHACEVVVTLLPKLAPQVQPHVYEEADRQVAALIDRIRLGTHQ